MEILLDTNQNERREGKKQLQAFHSQTVPAYGRLPPLGCRAAAQPPDLYQHGEIQERADQCKANHRYADPVRMEAVQSCSGSGADRQRTDTDQKTQAAYRYKNRTDALQNSENETRPGQHRPRTGRFFRQRLRHCHLVFGSGLNRRRCRGIHSLERVNRTHQSCLKQLYHPAGRCV